MSCFSWGQNCHSSRPRPITRLKAAVEPSPSLMKSKPMITNRAPKMIRRAEAQGLRLFTGAAPPEWQLSQ